MKYQDSTRIVIFFKSHSYTTQEASNSLTVGEGHLNRSAIDFTGGREDCDENNLAFFLWLGWLFEIDSSKLDDEEGLVLFFLFWTWTWL